MKDHFYAVAIYILDAVTKYELVISPDMGKFRVRLERK